MGLAVEVGFLSDMLQYDEEGAEWYRGQLAVVNEALASNGADAFNEPESLGELGNRCELGSYPYSWLHYLRRAYAYDKAGLGVDAVIGQNPPDADAVVMDEAVSMFCHLCGHSDAEGFYAPVDFAEIIFDDRLPGVMLGSSQRLQAELAAVAPALGISLVDGQLTDAEADRLNGTPVDAVNERELWTWFSHWEAARLSIAHSTMIVYQ